MGEGLTALRSLLVLEDWQGTVPSAEWTYGMQKAVDHTNPCAVALSKAACRRPSLILG